MLRPASRPAKALGKAPDPSTTFTPSRSSPSPGEAKIHSRANSRYDDSVIECLLTVSIAAASSNTCSSVQTWQAYGRISRTTSLSSKWAMAHYQSNASGSTWRKTFSTSSNSLVPTPSPATKPAVSTTQQRYVAASPPGLQWLICPLVRGYCLAHSPRDAAARGGVRGARPLAHGNGSNGRTPR